MDSSIFMLENWMLLEMRGSNGDYSKRRTEQRRNRLRPLTGRCKGLLPIPDNGDESLKSEVCHGDGKTCFHARWKEIWEALKQ
jgi:hypothetical protein